VSRNHTCFASAGGNRHRRWPTPNGCTLGSGEAMGTCFHRTQAKRWDPVHPAAAQGCLAALLHRRSRPLDRRRRHARPHREGRRQRVRPTDAVRRPSHRVWSSPSVMTTRSADTRTAKRRCAASRQCRDAALALFAADKLSKPRALRRETPFALPTRARPARSADAGPTPEALRALARDAPGATARLTARRGTARRAAAALARAPLTRLSTLSARALLI
jgi:hypothetical protein